MAKAGRNRLQGERYKNGALKTSVPKHEHAPSAVKRLADAAIAGMRDAEWGTVIGRYYLTKKLTSLEYATGKRWALTSADYTRHFGLTSPDPKSIAIGAPSRGEPPDPDSDAGQAMAKTAAKARKRFEEAHKALLKCGMQAESAVRRLCEGIGETPTGHEQFLHAKRGLKALADFWK